VNPRVTSALRTYAKQKFLYEQWQAGKSKYPAAFPGTSSHEYGYAFDLVVDGMINLRDVGSVWVSWGGVYGGEEDPVHFEHPAFKSLLQRGGLIAPPSVSYTPGTRLQAARRLADILVQFVPGLGIVSTASIASAIVAAVGGEVGPSTAVILYGLSHPEEFLGTFWDAMRSILLSYF
jgi:hypothetical protein